MVLLAEGFHDALGRAERMSRGVRRAWEKMCVCGVGCEREKEDTGRAVT